MPSLDTAESTLITKPVNTSIPQTFKAISIPHNKDNLCPFREAQLLSFGVGGDAWAISNGEVVDGNVAGCGQGAVVAEGGRPAGGEQVAGAGVL
jgi:hypothetical protein